MKKFLLFAFVLFCTIANAQTECKKTFYPSGKVKTETPYVDGKINGIVKEYFESGVLKSEDAQLDGETNGTYKLYFENGNLELEASYVKGKRNGVQKYYYISGSIETESNFVNGEMVSHKGYSYDDVVINNKETTNVPSKTYDNGTGNGGTIKEDYYPNGKLKRKTYYYANKGLSGYVQYKESGGIEFAYAEPTTLEKEKAKKENERQRLIYEENSYKKAKESEAAFDSYSNSLIKPSATSTTNSAYGAGTGDAKAPPIIYKTVGGSSDIIRTR